MERASAEPLAASPARERCIDRAAEQRLVLCQSRGSHGMVWMLRVLCAPLPCILTMCGDCRQSRSWPDDCRRVAQVAPAGCMLKHPWRLVGVCGSGANAGRPGPEWGLPTTSDSRFFIPSYPSLILLPCENIRPVAPPDMSVAHRLDASLKIASSSAICMFTICSSNTLR